MKPVCGLLCMLCMAAHGQTGQDGLSSLMRQLSLHLAAAAPCGHACVAGASPSPASSPLCPRKERRGVGGGQAKGLLSVIPLCGSLCVF